MVNLKNVINKELYQDIELYTNLDLKNILIHFFVGYMEITNIPCNGSLTDPDGGFYVRCYCENCNKEFSDK